MINNREDPKSCFEAPHSNFIFSCFYLLTSNKIRNQKLDAMLQNPLKLLPHWVLVKFSTIM